MTNVAVVIFEDIFEHGGGTEAVYRVLDVLKKMRCSVTVIACSDKNQDKLEVMDGIPIISLGKKLLAYKLMPFPSKFCPLITWNLKLSLSLLKNRFDMVYCYDSVLSFPSIYLVSKVSNYKIVFAMDAIFSVASAQVHSGMLLSLDRSLEKFVVKHSDHIITDGRHIFEFYQVYNKRIDVVPLFVDTTLFRAIDRPKNINSRVIGLVGPFTDTQRQSAAPNFIYSRVNDFDSRIRFVMIGRCDNKIKHNRISYTGYLDSVQDYANQLSHLDALLVPEAFATTGPLTKIIQAMSCSLPVFATPKAVGGLCTPTPGKDIFVFDENDLVDRINKLIFDDELMAEVGRNARNVVEQHYSKKVYEDKFIRLMESIINN